MNIIGNGVDIVNNLRIKNSIKNKDFINRVFTLNEINNSKKLTNKINYFAKRFAAKEALFKAVGVRNKLQFNDVEIKNSSTGLPNFRIKGTSLKNLKKILKNKRFKIHLSLSDDEPWAVATAIVFTIK